MGAGSAFVAISVKLTLSSDAREAVMRPSGRLPELESLSMIGLTLRQHIRSVLEDDQHDSPTTGLSKQAY